MTLVTTPKYEVLFSYETPVAALEIANGKLYRTDKKWSVTTSRQINKWLGGEEAELRPQEFFDGLNEAVKKAKMEESVINSITESINWIANRQMSVNEAEEVEGNDMDSEAEDKLWWTSSSGNIEIQMTLDQAESVSVGGQDASGAVAEVLEDPFIQDQLAKISDEELIKALSEYGAWDDEELQDRARNEERLIWIAGGDISEEQFMKGSDEDLDEANQSGSLDQALQYMNQLIAKGVEYPDAHTKAIMKFDVDGDDLAYLYDNQDLQESNLNESGTRDWTTSKVIDSRDIIERIEELEANSDEEGDGLDNDEREELALLNEFKDTFEQYGEWEDGAQLISANYWIEYVQEMLEDTGEIPRDLPHYIAIDWEKTADNISYDYSIDDVGGESWYVRNN